MVKYQWKHGSRFPVSAQTAGETLKKLEDKHGGKLTPEDVVNASRSERAPLHRCFTWDNDEAAEKCRKQEARMLMNCIYVVHVEEEQQKPPQIVYVNVETQEGGRAYMEVATVLGDKELRERALADALAALKGWQARYGHLQELARVFDAARQVEEELTRANGKAKKTRAKARRS